MLLDRPERQHDPVVALEVRLELHPVESRTLTAQPPRKPADGQEERVLAGGGRELEPGGQLPFGDAARQRDSRIPCEVVRAGEARLDVALGRPDRRILGGRRVCDRRPDQHVDLLEERGEPRGDTVSVGERRSVRLVVDLDPASINARVPGP